LALVFFSCPFSETFSSKPPLIRPPPRGVGPGQPGEAGESSSRAGRVPAGLLPVCMGWFCIFAGNSESGRRKFAYVNIDLHSPSQEDRPTVTEMLTKIRQLVQGRGILPHVNVQHSRAKIGYWPQPRAPMLDNCCSLRPRAEPQPRGVAHWSGCASAPRLCLAAADSHSSASGPLLGHLAPETHHLESRPKRQGQSGACFLLVSPQIA
jgi:hypothetical protein